MPGVVAAPAHWAFGIEKPSAVHRARGNLMQVVGVGELGAVENLVLQVAAVAEDAHAAQVAEAGTAYETFGEFVNPRCRHANLGPPATCQNGVVGVAPGLRRMACASRACFGMKASSGRRDSRDVASFAIYPEHETHEKLVFAVSLDNGAKAHAKHWRFAVDNHSLCHRGQG